MPALLEVGDPAPAFTLESGDAAPLTLQTFKGDKLVLYFYPKDDTSGCTKQAIEFNALRDAFADTGTKILGVSPDTLKSHSTFKGKHGLDLLLGSDTGKAALEAYGVWAEKSMYGRKYMGVDRSTFLIGRDGRIACIWRGVKVAGHVEAVLAAARDLV